MVDKKAIQKAFSKVKEDNLFLLQKIETLEQQIKIQKKEFIQSVQLLQEKMDLERAQDKLEKDTVKVIERQVPKSAVLLHKKFRGNTQSKVLHTMTCPYGKKIKDDHTQFYKSIDLAKSEGYTMCTCLKDVDQYDLDR